MRRWTNEERELLRQMHAEGATDTKIAQALFRHPVVVLRERQRLKLGADLQKETSRRKRAEKNQERSEDRKNLARSYGLPECLSSRQVAIIILLAFRGMLTRSQISSFLALNSGSLNCRHLPPLRQLGLLEYFRPLNGKQGGYLLSAKAMDLLEQAGQENSNGSYQLLGRGASGNLCKIEETGGTSGT